jgi:predicted DCC family thiol-disulfide oxidoreductase YuxK
MLEFAGRTDAMPDTPTPRLAKVYYNSLCPVCRAGIEGQRRRMTAAGAAAEWCDINQHPQALAEIGAEMEAVRMSLHVREADGTLAVGAEAFLALARATPGQGWLARLGGLPVIRPLFRRAYDAFAARLYRWNRRRGRW